MNRPARRHFPRYGVVGLAGLVLMEAAVAGSRVEPWQAFPWWRITGWMTPVCWWCYILAVDAWIYRKKGASLLTTRRELLALECLLSVAFWCVFEAYNRVMPGWRYVNLDENLSVRLAGYAIAFATIMPGMFLTAEWLQCHGLFAARRCRPRRWTASGLNVSMAVGAAFCFVPPFLPEAWRGYLWAMVWVGWFLMLEPINYRRGLPSLYRDWERGEVARTAQLLAAGAICGLLWEFWNMWAYTKWVYIFPPGIPAKYFEMPVLGFLGFLPFALDYFAMFHFLAGFFTRQDKLGL